MIWPKKNSHFGNEPQAFIFKKALLTKNHDLLPCYQTHP